MVVTAIIGCCLGLTGGILSKTLHYLAGTSFEQRMLESYKTKQQNLYIKNLQIGHLRKPDRDTWYNEEKNKSEQIEPEQSHISEIKRKLYNKYQKFMDSKSS